MSQHIREDKTCLNCGTTVEERYCTHCGQENVEIKESFGHLFRHFFEDLTHYDSKFFITIKDLLFKPGFLTKEYLAGKRANYLHPIRMYVFISFLYFLAMFNFSHSEHRVEEAFAKQTTLETKKQIAESLHSMLLNKTNDTLVDKTKHAIINDILVANKLDSLPRSYQFTVIWNLDYEQLKAYDSIQHSLPVAKRDTGLKPWLYHRWQEMVERHGKATRALISSKTEHLIPKMMFVLLPLFALLLKLFYSRKKYLYVNHAIFSLHFHAVVFLLFLFSAIVGKIFPALSNIFGILEIALIVLYLIVALRKAYQQSLLKSVFISFGMIILYSICMLTGVLIVGFTYLTFL
jgi:hypothetical protein